MPKFFFDLLDNGGLHNDEAGDDFASSDEARVQAQALLVDIFGEDLPDSELHVVRCHVRDHTGRIIYRGALTFEGSGLLMTDGAG